MNVIRHMPFRSKGLLSVIEIFFLQSSCDETAIDTTPVGAAKKRFSEKEISHSSHRKPVYKHSSPITATGASKSMIKSRKSKIVTPSSRNNSSKRSSSNDITPQSHLVRDGSTSSTYTTPKSGVKRKSGRNSSSDKIVSSIS